MRKLSFIAAAALLAAIATGGTMAAAAKTTTPGLDRGTVVIAEVGTTTPTASCSLLSQAGPYRLTFAVSPSNPNICVLRGFPAGSSFQVTGAAGGNGNVSLSSTGTSLDFALNAPGRNEYLIIPPDFP